MAVGTEVSVREWILSSRHGKIDAEHVIGPKQQQQHSYNKPEKGCPDKLQASVAIACRQRPEQAELDGCTDGCHQENDVGDTVCGVPPVHTGSHAGRERDDAKKNGPVHAPQ